MQDPRTLKEVFRGKPRQLHHNLVMSSRLTPIKISEQTILHETLLIRRYVQEGTKNYFISIPKSNKIELLNTIKDLDTESLDLYLKSSLLLEPFIENDKRNAIYKCVEVFNK